MLAIMLSPLTHRIQLDVAAGVHEPHIDLLHTSFCLHKGINDEKMITKMELHNALNSLRCWLEVKPCSKDMQGLLCCGLLL